LGDHQHSTRVVLAHEATDATYVRQSLDYAQFGRVTATLGANGLADATGVVTAFAHHGSLLDAATGLQLKAARWYSPDLGRFVSEDPIQDGANWYMFAGNDPVNFADPSGLSQQGHPLGGGFSGNQTRAPSIRPGNIPANTLSTLGNQLGHAVGSGRAPRSTPAPFVSPIRLADGSATPLISQRTLNELGPIVAENQRTAARNQQAQISASLRANVRPTIPGKAPYSAFTEYLHGVGEVFKGYGDAVVGTAEGLYNVGRHPINTVVGVATAVRHPVRTVQAIAADISEKSGTLRGQGAIVGDILTSIATGGAVKAVKEAGVLGKVLSKLPNGTGTAMRAVPTPDLPILNPHFVPNGKKVLQNLTTRENKLLAANLSRALAVLEPTEVAAAAGSRGIAIMQYGRAVEKLVAREINADPRGLGTLFEHNRGAGPDFFGRSHLEGKIYDITTPGQVPAHLARPYGQGLNTIIYQRPAGFP